MMKFAAGLVFLCFLPVTAFADETPDCKDPRDQATMTQCAALDYQKADQKLNEAWAKFKSDAEDSDEESGGEEYSDALLTSQKAWIAFRDAECVWQGFAAHGGSLEPQIISMCLSKLTRDRIRQLETGVSE